MVIIQLISFGLYFHTASLRKSHMLLGRLYFTYRQLVANAFCLGFRTRIRYCFIHFTRLQDLNWLHYSSSFYQRNHLSYLMSCSHYYFRKVWCSSRYFYFHHTFPFLKLNLSCCICWKELPQRFFPEWIRNYCKVKQKVKPDLQLDLCCCRLHHLLL